MRMFEVAKDTPSILIKLAGTQEPQAFFTRKENMFAREELLFDRVIQANEDMIRVCKRMEAYGMTHRTINRIINGDRMAFLRDGYLLLVSPSEVEVV